MRVDIKNDTAIAKYAKRHGRILVCHDRHKDEPTRYSLYQEIYHNGGQMIEIKGGSQQNVFECLGKFLIHRERWVDFFHDNEGIFVIKSDNKVACRQRKDLLFHIQHVLDIDVIPEIGPKAIHTPRHRKPQVRRAIPTEQQTLFEDGG